MTAGRFAALCAVSIAGAGCDPGEDKCGGSDLKYYDQALVFHLTRAGVPHRLERDGMVCVAPKYAPDFVAAERQVDKSFHEVAHLLRDSCEESAFVAWATKEKLRFDIRATLDARSQPSGKKMFLLRSFTHEELVSNADKLVNEAPKGVACGTPVAPQPVS